jgi:hypothetical protein
MEYIKENFNFFKGLSIQNCLRQFSENDFEEIPEDMREQEADGSTFLIFSNGDAYGFYPNSEEFSIEIKKIVRADIPSRVSDVSGNNFWKSVIDKKIVEVELLCNNLDSFYAIRFSFENNVKIDVEYISESDYTFDALIIRNPNVLDM